jgi:hypothetical protein
MTPPNIIVGRFSTPTKHWNGTLGDPSCLPANFPAKSGLLLARIRPSSPLAAPGPDCNLSSPSKDLYARGKDRVCETSFSDLVSKHNNL